MSKIQRIADAVEMGTAKQVAVTDTGYEVLTW